MSVSQPSEVLAESFGHDWLGLGKAIPKRSGVC